MSSKRREQQERFWDQRSIAGNLSDREIEAANHHDMENGLAPWPDGERWP